MPYKDKEKQREYQRKWMLKRRQKWIDENGPCICGRFDDLEIDHIDSNTKINHRVWSWREDKRLLELSKCQVLCRQCHLSKSELKLDGKYKYSRDLINEIRGLYAKGSFSMRELAEKYNIALSHIHRIISFEQRKQQNGPLVLIG